MSLLIRNSAATTTDLHALLGACCSEFGVSEGDVLSPDRHAEIVRVRHITCWLAREIWGASSKEIGRVLGRDPAAVGYAMRSVDTVLTHRHGRSLVPVLQRIAGQFGHPLSLTQA